jgi:guanine nucleotide-binding protein G(i) subunit alpha
MKIIHQSGYTVEELSMYRMTIYKNLVDCAKALIGAMRQFDIDPQIPINHEYSDYLIDYQVVTEPQTLNPEVGMAIKSLWKDPSMSLLMERQSEFYLMDSAP